MPADTTQRRFRFRLLPPDPALGWTPYAWLVYLAFFIGFLPLVATSTMDWALSIAGVILFLVLYFTGYWLRDRRIIWVIAGITAIGAVLAPGNPGACVFFIYAGAFAGFASPPRLSAAVIAAVVLVLATEAWLLELSFAFWIPGIVFTVIIGAVNSHFSEAARTRARLQRAEEEIERMAQLAERERIARDLHDLLGHTLSLITLKSELAGKLVTRDPERARAEIRDVERISRTALAEVRQTVAGYRATGFEAELANAKLATSAAGMTLRCQTADVAVGATESRLLGQVLREAVTNIIRHSRATECEVVLERHAKGLRLTITDNGRGLAHQTEGEGHGLSGMRQRLEAAGGSLQLINDDGLRLVAELGDQDPAATDGPSPQPSGAEAPL